MHFLKLACIRIKALFTRRAIEHDMEQEMRLHMDLLADECRRAGMSPEDAHYAALRRFGNIGHLKERGRDIRGAGILDDLHRDLRYAWRTLVRSPLFTAVVVLSLAIGIGANTALFSVFDALFLQDLPVRNPKELVAFGWGSGPSPHAFIPGKIGFIESRRSGEISTVFSTQFPSIMVDRFREAADTLGDFAAFAPVNTDLTMDGQSDEITAQVVAGNYFRIVGTTAVAGRLITEQDDAAAASPVVVISYDFWKRKFALDPAAVGKQILLSSVLPATIVGVTPPGFHVSWGISPDFSIPMAFMPQLAADLVATDLWTWGILGRMNAGVTIDQVRRNLQGVFVGSALEGMPAASPEDGPRLLAISGSQGFTSDYVLRSIGLSGTARRFSLLVILQAVFCILLLIVCLNVANLFIARAETRRYEMGVRLAMGAGRLRLIRQLLTESVLLALLGGGIGVVLAYWGKDVLRVFIQQNSQLVLDLQINPRILGFSVGVSLLTGIAFGLLPAFRATRMDVQSAVKAGSRNFTGSRAAIGKSLLVAQVAMSLVLLIGAGLLIRTLGNLPSQDVGYSTDKLLVFGVNRYVLGADRNRYEQIIEKIGAIPGVTAATASFDAFIGPNASFTSGNFRPPMDDQPQVRTGTVRLFFIRPNFFEVLGIPVLRGRGFDAGDVRGSTRVAVITESLARQFGTDPIGWRFGGDGRPVIEIVGVVKNVGISEIRNTGLTSEIHGTVFLPELQTEAPGLPSFAGVFSVRTATAAFSLVPQIRSALREIDPRLRAFDIATETQQVERKLAPTWRIAIAWSLFGGVALMLTSIGLYGLLSHSVARRTNELGIRIALGAGRYHVMRLVIGQTLFLVAIGLGFGLVASMILNQTIRALIYGVTFYDPPTVAMAIVVMLAVAGAATYLPARRAARVDPTVALRYE